MNRTVWFLSFFALQWAATGSGLSQATAPAPPESTKSAARELSLRHPGDIYKDAMHPLDVVRNSLDNWSDPELAALAAGIRKAKVACAAAKPEDYVGDDLYDLGRVCALGQDWNSTHEIAMKYIATGEETHRARAYAMSINALIHMGDRGAVDTAHEMLRKLPYDAAVAESIGYLTTYLEQSLDPAALQLALDHKPRLLQAIANGQPLLEAHGNDSVSLGILYETVVQIAFLQRYTGEDSAAEATIAELKTAVAAMPPAAPGVGFGVEDQLVITAIDAQYALLGKSIPNVEIYKGILNPTGKPKINQARGSITALLLFPEWCAQCRKMMKPLTALAIRPDARLRAYGLLFRDGQQASDRTQDGGFLEANDKELQGTPTLFVSAATPAAFGAAEYPLGIVTDRKGRIAFIGILPGNAFDSHGFMEEILSRVSSGGPIFPAEPKGKSSN